MIELANGAEFTCRYDELSAARQTLHTDIVSHLLASPRSNPNNGATTRTVNRSPAKTLFGSDFDLDRQHIFIVVGVPGSGKDTTLKRFLRSLGVPLLDASVRRHAAHSPRPRGTPRPRVTLPATRHRRTSSRNTSRRGAATPSPARCARTT